MLLLDVIFQVAGGLSTCRDISRYLIMLSSCGKWAAASWSSEVMWPAQCLAVLGLQLKTCSCRTQQQHDDPLTLQPQPAGGCPV